tara:strand:+ start:3726 stop:3953 length:228 start_codon:yes stop_codon:yes gene_type:complete
MSLDNIKLSYGKEGGYTSIKADFTFNTLEINKDMNNKIKISLGELPDLIDILIKLQNLDALERIDNVEYLKINYD